MNWAYLLSGVIAFALFIYLFVALLKPEKFE
jgi:K+-transporting ATPase KdpF subunit